MTISPGGGPAVYRGQLVSLATRHHKEAVIARPFRRGLGLNLVLASDFDTDSLGTFSGERPRPGDAASTCRRKAEAGMASTGLSLGLASEGSFGPHPEIPWLPAGLEWMTFIDAERDLVISEQLLCTQTNFSHQLVGGDDDPSSWLRQIGFPSHAVIVSSHQPRGDLAEQSPLAKGIQDYGILTTLIKRAAALSSEGRALLETDMRAHCNPTRMRAIRRLTFRLVRRINASCPICVRPGWGPEDSEAGLPCAWCQQPTALTQAVIFGCRHCGHRLRRERPDGLRQADPGHCSSCNP